MARAHRSSTSGFSWRLVALRLRRPTRGVVLIPLRWACGLAVIAGAITATNVVTAI